MSNESFQHICILMQVIFIIGAWFFFVRTKKLAAPLINENNELRTENAALRAELGRKLQDIAKEININIYDVLENQRPVDGN